MAKKTIGIEGINEAIKALRELHDTVAHEHVAVSLNEAIKPMYDDALSGVHDETGTLKRSIKKRVSRSDEGRKDQVAAAYVTAGGKSGGANPVTGQYAGEYILSHSFHDDHDSVANNFLGDAFNKNYQKSLYIFRDHLGKDVEKTAKKIGRKNARKLKKLRASN